LGLCFALNLARSGFRVLGIDRDADYVDLINSRKFRSAEPEVEALLDSTKDFYASTDLESAVRNSQILFAFVATPSRSDGSFDHSQIDAVVARLAELGPQAQPRHLVVSCTTMPGYCDQVAATLKDLNWVVSYSPEFIAQGRIIADQIKPEFILLGCDGENQAAQLKRIYEQLCVNRATFHVMSRKSAELAKLALNCFLTTKIAFANFIGDVATKAGADFEKILAAVGSDSRVGSKYFSYGYGFGGPCLPRDNRALAVFAEELGLPALISRATDTANLNHLHFQMERFRESKSMGGEHVIESVTYKPDCDSIEASQQLEFAAGLAKRGYRVTIRERQAVIEKVKSRFAGLFAKYEAKD
jgi:UDPglucose 6-dehydrogenase